jgi:kinesin family protein 6/9
VIQLSERGISARKIAAEFNVGKTQIQNIVNKKNQFLEDFKNNASPDRKRRSYNNGNEQINKLSWTWYQDARERRINVTGALLQEKARKFARELGNDNFKASNGWLESFRHRHRITFTSKRKGGRL